MAKLYITEYEHLAHDGRGQKFEIGQEPGYEQTPVVIGGTSLQSAAFRRETNYVRLHADAACSVVFGDNPTATVANRRLEAGDSEYFGVLHVTKLAVIANTPASGSGTGGGRTILQADADLYVATTGNDTTGDGSSGNPWATIKHAMDVISEVYDIAGFTVTVHIGAGTFVGLGLKGAVGAGIVSWQGASEAATIVGNGVNDGIYCLGAAVDVQVNSGDTVHYFGNMTIETTTDFKACINMSAHAMIRPGDPSTGTTNLTLKSTKQKTSFINVNSINGFFDAESADCPTLTLDAPANMWQAISVSNGACCILLSDVTVTGNPAWTFYMFSAFDNGLIFSATNFFGTATGKRFNVSGLGLIDTQGQGPLLFPGTVDGTVDSGGVYK